MSTDADGSDPVYNLSLDEMGRIMKLYRGADADPKGRFVYHAAGNPMQAILRDRDFDAGWDAAPASGLEELDRHRSRR